MAYGIEVRNTADRLIIDDNYPCLVYKSQGSVTVSTMTTSDTWGTSGTVYTKDIVVTNCNTPMLVIDVPLNTNSSYVDPVLGYFTKSVAGSTYTFTIVGAGSGLSLVSSFNYYVFDKPTQSTSGHGLQLFDQYGNVTFDSSISKLINLYTPMYRGAEYALPDSASLFGAFCYGRGGLRTEWNIVIDPFGAGTYVYYDHYYYIIGAKKLMIGGVPHMKQEAVLVKYLSGRADEVPYAPGSIFLNYYESTPWFATTGEAIPLEAGFIARLPV